MNSLRSEHSQPRRAAFWLVRACLALLAFSAQAEELPPVTSVVTGFRSAAEKDGYTLSVELIGQPETRVLRLHNPERVVLDMQNTVSSVPVSTVSSEGPVVMLRDGLVSDTGYRIVIQTRTATTPTLVRTVENGRTVLRLKIADATVEEAEPTSPSQSQIQPVDQPNADTVTARYKVVLDPGHGGIDTGATGREGTSEKELNLDFGRSLRAALLALGNVDVVMTRDSDVFIPLSERSAIARREQADLFISLHADSIRYKNLRGATVYTLSEKASDSLSEEIAEGENAADRFAGADWEKGTPDIHDILVDLVRRETDGFSRHLAASLVLELGRNEIRLINNPRRSAGFRVLMAPDVPSVLLEIGYLSNKDDETLLITDKWQAKAAAAVASAVGEFLQSRSAIADMVKP